MNLKTAENISEPIQLPPGEPVPFARNPRSGSYFPVLTSHPRGKEIAFQKQNREIVGRPGRRFLASRTDGKRYHVAVDLFANNRDPVVACEDGRIVNFYHFYHGSWALFVEHDDLVINYGEVAADSLKKLNLRIGDSVKAGQQIAIVGKMHKSSMLHFETYIKGTKKNQRFIVGQPKPPALLNPTRYLLALRDEGLKGKAATPSSATPVSRSNWSKAIRLNRHYAAKLGWNKFYIEINDLLLPFSGLDNVSLGEEAFAEAVAKWQKSRGFSSKDLDGIIGPNTWAVMKTQIPEYSNGMTGSSSGITSTASFGKLKIDTSIRALSTSFPEYQFTAKDALWLARFVEGEAGGKDDADSHAVIWAMFNRFGILRHKVPAWGSYGSFLQKYSTTLQPLLNSAGAAERVWANHNRNPGKYPVVSSEETYKGTNIKKVQYLRHIKLQQKSWNDFAPYVTNMITKILSGEIPNPGIGIATHFLSTYVLLKAKRRKQGLSDSPSDEEWRHYTLQFARNKGLVWIGEKPNLNQKKNAFFIQPKFSGVNPGAVKIESEFDFEFLDEFLSEDELEFLEIEKVRME